MMKTLKCFFALFSMFLFAVVPGKAGQMTRCSNQCNSVLVTQISVPLLRVADYGLPRNSPAPWVEKLKNFSFTSFQGVNCEFSFLFKNRIVSTLSSLSQQTQVFANTATKVKIYWLYQKVPP